MTLVITIFVLVFVTELISWIGQSVLLDFVGLHFRFCVLQKSNFSNDRHTPSIYEYSTHPILYDKEISKLKF